MYCQFCVCETLNWALEVMQTRSLSVRRGRDIDHARGWRAFFQCRSSHNQLTTRERRMHKLCQGCYISLSKALNYVKVYIIGCKLVQSGPQGCPAFLSNRPFASQGPLPSFKAAMRAQSPVILVLLGIYISLCGAVEWHLCGSDSEAISIKDVAVSPDPIQAGLETIFILDASQRQDVEVYAGTLEASVKYLGVRVFKKTGDLCEALSCPLLPGDSSLALKQTMPGFLPPGKMVLTLQATRNDSLPLFCVDIELNGKKVGNGRGIFNLLPIPIWGGSASTSVV